MYIALRIILICFILCYTSGIFTQINSNLIIRNGCGEGEIIAISNPTLGESPYQISWSTGESGHIVTGLVAGQYRLTITDAIGTELIEDFSIPFVPPFRVSHQTIDATCADSTDGIANLIISGGIEPYDITWSNGANEANLNNLGAGTYTYNVSSNGCARAGQIVINASTPIEVNIDFSPNMNGNIDAIATASGGRPPYTYQWRNGLTGRTLLGILPNTELTIQVTDANNCSFTTTAVAVAVYAQEPDSPVQVFRIFPNPVSAVCTIELADANSKPYDIQVLTDTGIVIREEKQISSSDYQMDMSSLPAGIYFVALQQSERRWIQRVALIR